MQAKETAVANLEKRRRSKGGKRANQRAFLTLAKVIEEGLMRYYMEHQGYAEPEELYDDALYSDGVFGRVQPWQERNILAMYKKGLRYDLDTNPLFCKVQEFFLGLEKHAGRCNNCSHELYDFLPEKPVGDHITHITAFFEALP